MKLQEGSQSNRYSREFRVSPGGVGRESPIYFHDQPFGIEERHDIFANEAQLFSPLEAWNEVQPR